MGSAYFYDFLELFGLLVHFLLDELQTGQQGSMSFKDGSNVHDSGEAIVAGLPHIYMVIGMD